MLRVGRTMLVDRASIFVQYFLGLGIVPLTPMTDENIRSSRHLAASVANTAKRGE